MILMEERPLNFNQPKVNSKKTHNSKLTLPPLPFYKSGLISGPVRNPGVVPFQREQMPRRAEAGHIVLKDDNRQLAVAPKLPLGRTQEVYKEPEKETKEDDYDSDDENVTFVDAHETLSWTESFYNCSVLSGLDDPHMACSGVFGNTQIQDIMMDRFLPAAKALASETPHFGSRKHSSAREKSEPVKRVIKWKKQSPQYILHDNIQGEEEDDDDEDEDVCARMEDVSAKLCGLLPKFWLLNPMPGMRDHVRGISSVRSVRTRPAYAESCRKSENKERTHNHRGELKRPPHQLAPRNEPSTNENLGRKSRTPLKDGSPQLFLDERRYLRLPQERRDMQNHGSIKLKELLGNPTINMTLYMDSEFIEQPHNSISRSLQSRGRNPSVDSLQYIRLLTDENQISQPKSSDTGSSVVSTLEMSFQDVGEDLHRDQDFGKPDVGEAIQENTLFGLAPYFLKTPSESWLSRTLHSKSLPVDPMRIRNYTYTPKLT